MQAGSTPGLAAGAPYLFAASTVPYEVLCRVGTRIERIYNAAE
jgi:hypothetical protein